MNTAVIIAGHARTFKWVFASQHWQVFRKLPAPVFFASIVDDPQAGDIETELRKRYPADRVFVERIPSQPDCARAMRETLHCTESELDAMTHHAPYALAPHANPQTVLRALWHQSRAYQFAHETIEAKEIANVGVFVRHRPDLFFHRFEMPELAPSDCCVPYWGGYGGINDRFAVMGYEAARHYFNTFNRVADLLRRGAPMHPESLSGAALEDVPVRVRPTLIAEFTGVRLPNEQGQMETVPAVITQQDHFRFTNALSQGL